MSLRMLLNSRRAFCKGNAKLLCFFFDHLLDLFRRLPSELYDAAHMSARMSEQKPFMLSVPLDFVEGYAQALGKQEREIDALQYSCPIVEHKTKQVFFWLVRAAVVAAAWSGSFRCTFLVSLLQFVVLPYSLFVSVGYGIVTVLVLYSGHIIVFPLLTWLIRCLIPEAYNISIAITPFFVVAFLAADQLLCALCLCWTPGGKTQPLPPKRVLESVIYGFLNCKTYWLVLLPLCFELEVPLIAWGLDAALGLSGMITRRAQCFWEAPFYHVHRMGHIKHVYPDAHKFHHYLHDSTAFDAHIFGSGAPEEWLILMADLALACGLGIAPASLSYHVLSVSWFDKWGLHTRHEGEALHDDNFHVDHHARHSRNFGFHYPYELLMKTAMPELGNEVEWAGYKIKRDENQQMVMLQFTPVAGVAKQA